MTHFSAGVLVGIIFMGLMTFAIPLQLSAVQKELVAQGHATYHPLTRKFILKECK